MDAEELNAVTNIFCKDRKDPLLIGSIKSNIGHTESCADLLSVVKALICFETGIIPPNENYSSPNRLVPGLVNGKLKVRETYYNHYKNITCAGLIFTFTHILSI